jgi:vacuolar-type H+-ATPase subunit H
MGFAYDDSGLPVMASAKATNGQGVVAPHSWPIDPTSRTSATDDQIGDILIEVQRFASESAGEAERTAQAIVESARTDAARAVEDARQQATRQAQTLVESARAEADQIVQQARQQAAQQAQTIVEGARNHAVDTPTPARVGVSADAVANLSASIAEFADTNRQLIEELVQLRDSLGEPQEQRQPWEELQVPSPPRN